jgi:hypothetical protein
MAPAKPALEAMSLRESSQPRFHWLPGGDVFIVFISVVAFMVPLATVFSAIL